MLTAVNMLRCPLELQPLSISSLYAVLPVSVSLNRVWLKSWQQIKYLLMFFYWGKFILGIPSSVGSNDLVHPGTQHGDTSVHTRWRHTAESTAPRHNTNQSPSPRLLTDQRTTGVTLKRDKKAINRERDSTVTMFGLHVQTYFSLGPTMHEEAPEAPAQIIRSVILLPQNLRHSSLVSRGRAACCKRAGVSGAAAKKKNTNKLHPNPTPWNTLPQRNSKP